MSLPQAIAIDGPAASGKSTLGKKLAEALGYLYFDTGVLYRAVTWLALEKGVPIEDEAGVTALAQACEIDLLPASIDDGRDNDVLVDGLEVTWAIRSPAVDANVSPVSAYPGVRAALSAQQRRIGLRGRVVMVGRDIGTVVLPEAGLKIYLEASAEQRARRRCAQQRQRGLPADYDEILAAVRQRDQIDSTRDVSPLRPAPDAVVVDSDKLDAEGVLELVKGLIGQPGRGKTGEGGSDEPHG
jgi:cytidylate kinase